MKHDSHILFESLYQRYADELYGYICAHTRQTADADDCFQQAWLRINQALSTYNEQGNERAWLYRISRNCCIDYYRGQSKHANTSEYIDEQHNKNNANPQTDHIACQELADFLHKSLEELPVTFRELHYLRLQQNLSYKEIASILDEPENRLQQRFHNGMQELKKAYDLFQKKEAFA